MKWYSAHIVMFVELKDKPQLRFPVWENIVLISARSEDEAFKKAERRGRGDEGDDDGTFRWGRRPARWVFAGVRKLTECDDPFGRPDDGSELSYTEFELSSRRAIQRFTEGKPVEVRLNDRYPEKRTRVEKIEARRATKRPA